MKVLNFIAEGRYGGPHARILQVARRLRAQDFDTTVALPSKDSESFRRKLEDAEVAFVEMRRLARLSKEPTELTQFLWHFAPGVRELAHVIRATRADVVHCNGAWQLQGALAGRLARVPVLWHLNDTYMPSMLRGPFNLTARLCADGFILAGERARKYYLTDEMLGKRPSAVIQAPVDLARFDPDRATPHPKISALPGPRIVTVANVNPAKDVATFVRTCALLKKRFHGLSFVVVGAMFPSQRQYTSVVRSLASEHDVDIQFVGPIEDIPGVLRATDVYVCSSATEASPMAVWEAMAMACPIVSTDVGDVRRLVEGGGCGFVVPTRDAAALAAAVGRLLDAPPMRREMGSRARAVAARELGLDACAEAHAAIYRAVVASQQHA